MGLLGAAVRTANAAGAARVPPQQGCQLPHLLAVPGGASYPTLLADAHSSRGFRYASRNLVAAACEELISAITMPEGSGGLPGRGEKEGWSLSSTGAKTNAIKKVQEQRMRPVLDGRE